jgi:DNA-binding Lrp family transcriptional regulator
LPKKIPKIKKKFLKKRMAKKKGAAGIPPAGSSSAQGPYALDEKDRRIIAALSESPRASIAEISKRTGIKRDSVSYRMEKLAKDGILGFSADIGYRKAGFNAISVIYLTLQNFGLEREKQLRSFLESSRNIVSYSFLSGRNDCMAKAACRSEQEMNMFIREIRMRFSSIIKDITADSLMEERKKGALP